MDSAPQSHDDADNMAKKQPANQPDAKDTAAETAAKPKKQKEEGSIFAFALKLFLLVFILRSFVFAMFTIPSESMLPTLANGDYLVASKWPYGYSRYSLPFSLPLIPGRIFASQPDRGDIVIFKHPIDQSDYIKRVVALPGDTVEMANGQLVINGKPVPSESVQPFKIAVSPNTSCASGAQIETFPGGDKACVYQQSRETLPGGVSHMELDFGETSQDNTPPVIVPEDQLFVMGDNRDNSQDSRFPATPGGGVGMLPQAYLVGRAEMIVWSTDGSAEWIKPWTWFSAARWSRIGTTL